MSVISTELQKYSNTVKEELWAERGYCRTVATAYEAAAKTYKVGDILGKITASGKVKMSVDTAVDGSQTPYAIVLEDKAVAATTDTKVLVMFRGPASVSNGGLYFDASYNDADKLAAYEVLEGKGIQVLSSIG